MNFLLTTFYEQLLGPVEIVPSRSIRLENPAVGSELEYVQDLFRRSVTLDGMYVSMIPGMAMHTHWPLEASEARERARAATDDEGIPFEEGRELLEQVASAAAKEVIIVRFDDEGSLKILDEARAEAPPNAVVFLPDEDPLFLRAKEARVLCDLISLLICDVSAEGELGKSFVLDDEIAWSVDLGESIGHSLLSQSMVRTRHDDSSTGYHFTDLRHYRDDLVSTGHLLSTRFETYDPNDPLLYAAELINLANSSSDLRTRLVNLVSLLELLLARKPDTSRYTVEDSLTKQFVLKLGVLLHAEDSSRNMNWVRMALRDLYAIRSTIAHGQFSSLDKMLSKSRFAQPDDEDNGHFSPLSLRLEAACEFAYQCARCTVRATLADPELVRFLKEN